MTHFRESRHALSCGARWLACGLSCALLAQPGEARAACPPEPYPAFAGHTFPLDAPLEEAEIVVEQVFEDVGSFAQPIAIVTDNGDRVFVAERGGSIWVFDNDENATSKTLFLDLNQAGIAAGRRHIAHSEMGLLSLVFDPDFDDPASDYYGSFYVYYTVAEADCACSADDSCPNVLHHCSQVVRFVAPSHVATSVDATTAPYERLLQVEQPYGNHNGATLLFGPTDGMLYLSLGDGGSGGDPQENGQDPSTPLGSLLRMDPHAPPDFVPADNPVPLGQLSGHPLTWHFGLRNPWRMSFDRDPPHDLWIGDVGQGLWEEVSRLPGGTAGGLNFGWRICEGTHDFDGDCTAFVAAGAGQVVAPVLEYTTAGAAAVTGGYVYRGDGVPDLTGRYLFADYSTSRIYAWDRTTVDGDGLGVAEPIHQGLTVSSFGEIFRDDGSGELYVLDYGGQIYKFAKDTAGNAQPFPERLSETGLFNDVATLTPAAGLIEYEVASQLWSDHADKTRWLALPAGGRIAFHATGAWEFPVGTAIVKHFELPAPPGISPRLETRVLLRQTNAWLGFTYRWNELGTDADLLTRSVSEVVDVERDGVPAQQTWTHPSPSDCLGCHTDAGGRILGVRTRQLNHPGPLAGNQLEALDCSQRFDAPIGDAGQFGGFAALGDEQRSLQQRARSHFQSNCAFCHAPGAPAPGGLDLRYDVLLGDMALLGVAPSEGDLGIVPDPRRIQPGAHAQSVLWARMDSSDEVLRMAKGTRERHDEAVDLVADWIDGPLVTPDSDEDGAPDDSDNCPSVANPAQEDGSPGNGFGDACDPALAADLTAAPDNPGSAKLGQILTLRGEVDNAGAGAAAVSQVRFYLSPDGVFDLAEDRLVGSCFVPAVAASETQSCVEPRARVPSDLAEIGEGETLPFYWVACADGLELVFESDENNNCQLDASPILVPEPSPGCQALAAAFGAWLARHSPRCRGRRAGRAGAEV